jgi:hypothetical protein
MIKCQMMLDTMLFCGNHSRYWLPHIEFPEFRIFFHNLGQIFRELRSHAREVFRVCLNLVHQSSQIS